MRIRHVLPLFFRTPKSLGTVGRALFIPSVEVETKGGGGDGTRGQEEGHWSGD